MSLIEKWKEKVVMVWQNTPILKRHAAMAVLQELGGPS